MTYRFVRYSKDFENVWNDFVRQSWNGVFLFNRNFMDYHSHLFTDFSLLVYKGKKLNALLPANVKDGVVHSHQGLTYGGWILSERFSSEDLVTLYQETENYLLENDITRIEYKHKPYVFEKHANDSDAWVMWNNNYELWRRDLSYFIDIKNFAGFAKDKRYRLNKSGRNNLRIEEQGNIDQYMELVSVNLGSKYNTKPVHTAEEVFLLQNRFPKNIQTLTVFQEDLFLGGTWLFKDNDFLHTQYFHFNDAGRDLCAAEYLVNFLLEKYGKSKRYFNFGTSTESDGKELNSGLASFKEGFGASGFCHDFYRKDLCR